MKPVIYYCYDAYCGWCYGFSPVINRIAEIYQGQLDFETLSGGMIPRESAKHIGHIASYIKDAYKIVEDTTGVTFGDDYLWHIKNPELSDWYPHSEKAAIALSIFKEYLPNRSVQCAGELQKALYLEGRDLTDDEAYRHLLEPWGIPEDEFFAKLKDTNYLEKARYETELVRQLRVNSFPAVLMQTAELKFYLVSKGYTDQETMTRRIENILEEIQASS
jgi:putative protein-disulfide isomerase